MGDSYENDSFSPLSPPLVREVGGIGQSPLVESPFSCSVVPMTSRPTSGSTEGLVYDVAHLGDGAD